MQLSPQTVGPRERSWTEKTAVWYDDKKRSLAAKKTACSLMLPPPPPSCGPASTSKSHPSVPSRRARACFARWRHQLDASCSLTQTQAWTTRWPSSWRSTPPRRAQWTQLQPQRLTAPQVEVIGLTTTFGNCRTTMSTANALHLCEMAGRTDVPVAQARLRHRGGRGVRGVALAPGRPRKGCGDSALTRFSQGAAGPLKGGANERFADYVHGADGACAARVRCLPAVSAAVRRPGKHRRTLPLFLPLRPQRRPVHRGLRERQPRGGDAAGSGQPD